MTDKHNDEAVGVVWAALSWRIIQPQMIANRALGLDYGRRRLPAREEFGANGALFDVLYERRALDGPNGPVEFYFRQGEVTPWGTAYPTGLTP